MNKFLSTLSLILVICLSINCQWKIPENAPHKLDFNIAVALQKLIPRIAPKKTKTTFSEDKKVKLVVKQNTMHKQFNVKAKVINGKEFKKPKVNVKITKNPETKKMDAFITISKHPNHPKLKVKVKIVKNPVTGNPKIKVKVYKNKNEQQDHDFMLSKEFKGANLKKEKRALAKAFKKLVTKATKSSKKVNIFSGVAKAIQKKLFVNAMADFWSLFNNKDKKLEKRLTKLDKARKIVENIKQQNSVLKSMKILQKGLESRKNNVKDQKEYKNIGNGHFAFSVNSLSALKNGDDQVYLALGPYNAKFNSTAPYFTELDHNSIYIKKDILDQINFPVNIDQAYKCDNLTNSMFPDLTFDIEGSEYTLSHENYISRDLNNKNELICKVNIKTIESLKNEVNSDIVQGNIWFKNFHVRFNTSENTFSMGKYNLQKIAHEEVIEMAQQ